MSSPIVYIDRSAIRAGKLEEVRAALRGLVEFVDSAEPQHAGFARFASP